MSKQILVLPGDGIGPEIMAEAVKVLQLGNDKFQLDFELSYYHHKIDDAIAPRDIQALLNACRAAGGQDHGGNLGGSGAGIGAHGGGGGAGR